MRTSTGSLALALCLSLVACAEQTPQPAAPRREQAPPPRPEPAPQTGAQPDPTPPPKARFVPPPCVIESASKAYCLREALTNPLPCRGPRCRGQRVFQVIKMPNQLVLEVNAYRAGRPLRLTDQGVLVTSPGHAVVGPDAILVLAHQPGKTAQIQASDLLAPSRFLTWKPFQTEVRGQELHLLVEAGLTVSLDLETLQAKSPDVHCQALAKGRVVISRSRFGATGTTAVARGTCEKPLEEWSFESPETVLAVTPNGKRLVTRNTATTLGLTTHLATVWEPKGKVGLARRQLFLRDVAKLTERLPPATCRGYACRAQPAFDFALGGALTLRFPWGGEKKVDLLNPALGRPERATWAYGPKPTPKTAGQHPWMGDPNAKATLMVYGDLQCPYTGNLMEHLRDLLRVQPKGIKVVWADYPLAMHPQAYPAALAARSVLAQRGQAAFFAFLELVLRHRSQISPDALATWAQAVGAKAARVKSDLEAQTHRADIDASKAAGAQAGVRGTPSLFLNGTRAQHANGFWAIRSQLEPVLGKALRPVR